MLSSGERELVKWIFLIPKKVAIRTSSVPGNLNEGSTQKKSDIKSYLLMKTSAQQEIIQISVPRLTLTSDGINIHGVALLLAPRWLC